MSDALESNDMGQGERAVEPLDYATASLNCARAELGARRRSLDVMQTRPDSEEIDLEKAISDDYYADLVEVISELTGRQVAFEASLQASAQILRMTLLNYL